MKNILTAYLLVFTSLNLLGQSAEEYFEPLKYRNIGPFRGGRSVCATGVPGDPMTYYMGTTGGGLWKTSDAGQRWDNISDGYFKTGSVGAVAVAPSQTNIVYVGMGEHAPRGVMTSYGDGVYKSIDGGNTWKHLGLEKTQHISRIIIHPNNPDILWVAAQGAIFGPTAERGIYKSTDGGNTWRKVLFVNELTGCSELSMDPAFPDIMYAAMWRHQRKPWKVISGGEGSGLYKSTDGGESWFKIENGLPGPKGKMAVSVSPDNSQKVYALVESDSDKDLGGLFVSENGGNSWTRISDDNRLTQRAWYYTEVFADPQDENTVYVLSAPALRSIDGGKSWEILSGTHGDFHDLWINPDNNNNMVIANDGGAAITFNQGKTWSTQSNMPTAQFYRVTADNLFPYNLYGGQQDNTSVKIPSWVMGSGGINEHHWTYSAGGESAFLAFDPENPRYVMGGSYLGTIDLMDMESKASTNIMAAPIQYLGKAARDMKYLYNWNAPIIWSQHEPGTFYHCAQVVLRTRDRGLTWEEVSPDLTRNIDEKQGKGGGPLTNEAVGAENYGTISYMVESPHEKGVFYTGSDDGKVYITKDNASSWQDITPKGLNETLVNAIEISPHDPATAYIATTRYKFNDYTPAIYKTTNYGMSWENISKDIPYGAFTRVVREDLINKDILYAGTELGIFISWNGGANWEPFQLNLPVTPITDLMVHQNDLLVATSGRSFWILDDIELLSQYAESKRVLYEPNEALYGFWGSPMSGNTDNYKGTDPFEGVNPARGMVLYYELPEDSLDISLEIFNAEGKKVRGFTSQQDESFKKYDGGPPAGPVLPNNKGLNRFVWDLRNPIMPGVPGVYIEGSYRGHTLNPGKYKIRLQVKGQTYEVDGEIVDNPEYTISKAQYEEYHRVMSEMESNLIEMHEMTNRLYDVQQQLGDILTQLEDEHLLRYGVSLHKALTAWDEKMVQRKSKAYDDVENFPNKFTAEYLFLINQTESSLPRVNESSKELKKALDAEWDELKSWADHWLENDLKDFNKQLWDAGIGAIQIKK